MISQDLKNLGSTWGLFKQLQRGLTWSGAIGDSHSCSFCRKYIVHSCAVNAPGHKICISGRVPDTDTSSLKPIKLFTMSI